MKKLVGFYIIFVCLLFLSHYSFAMRVDNYQLSFLNIGQGDSIYIRTPDNCRIFIDAGAPNTLGDSLMHILPFNARNIDLAILTHPDIDHYGGFTTVANKYNFQNVLISPFSKDSISYNRLIQDLSKQGSNIQTITNHTQASFCGLQFQLQAFVEANGNDSSVVSHITFPNGVSLLNSGDISIQQELMLVEQDFPLRSNIFKANHHGSNSSNSLGYINKIKPDYIIIQSGLGNSYGHPHSNVLKNAQTVGALILRNDLQGQIDFFFSKDMSLPQQTLELVLEK